MASSSSSETQCKYGFFSDPEKSQNVMCVETMCDYEEKTDACGAQLIQIGYSVDFYMIDRETTDTVYLSPDRGNQLRHPTCIGEINDFTCSGIKVKDAVYSCGGRGQCRGDAQAIASIEIPGNWNVYARLVTEDGEPIEGPRPLLIDSFRSESDIDEDFSMKLTATNP